MANILVIPDTHGRDFWIEACKDIDAYDKVIFLGDYHDPYTGEVSKKKSKKLIKNDLVPFVESYPDKIICLLGNHDQNYLYKPISNRVDFYNYDKIAKLLKKLNLKKVYQIDNCLFSHSGVLPLWLKLNNLTVEDINNLPLHSQAFSSISPYRGGEDLVGSCIFGDIREYAKNEHIPDLFQVFGHSRLKFQVVTKDFACLDCCKVFTMDTKDPFNTLKEWNA